MIHTATIKIKVVIGEPSPPTPPPPPVVRETRIRIRVDDPASLTWGIYGHTMAEGHAQGFIDWGDETTTEIVSGQNLHTYAQTGEYEVRISDDISELRCVSRAGTSPFQLLYAPMIRGFRTNAERLEEIGMDCFYKTVNLAEFHCEGSGVREIAVRSFQYCTGLVGRLDLPGVDTVETDAFKAATGITELHFSKANEAAITALPGFATSFGAVNAQCVFDL